MKRIVLGVVGVLAALILAYVGYAASRPSHYHVERTRVIAAPVETIRPQAEDLRNWAAWSPWDRLDPTMTKEFSQPSAGQGAWYAWQGNDQVGRGRMSISRVAPDHVEYDLEFIEPFASRADVNIAYVPEGSGTRVTWGMDGENDFVSKLFTAMMNMDAMIGADFERGLANLDARVTGR